MKIKTLITISLSLVFAVTLILGILTVPTTAALAEQVAQAPTEVVTPETDIQKAKKLKEAKKQQKKAEKEAEKQQKKAEKEAKKQQKKAEKEAEVSEPITLTPAQCNCNCGRGPLSGGKSGSRCLCIDGCP